MWFSVANDEIVSITPGGTQMKVPTSARPTGITAGRDGNIWVAENGFILRYTP
jgi:streptogramin lyase